MILKIILGVIVFFALLGTIGADTKTGKQIAAVIAIAALILFVAVMSSGSSKQKKEKKVTEVAPEAGIIQVDQDQWGTITITDEETGITTEYQGCIHISGTYPYETQEFMGLCISMDRSINIGSWSQGMYKLYYEDREAYWEKKKEEEAEGGAKTIE